MRRRTVARGAAAALAIGLALLAGLAVFSTHGSARAMAAIAENEQTSQEWNQVYLKVSIEYEQLVDFLRADSAVGRQPLISSIGSAEPNLRWLTANGAQADVLQARALQNTYGGYSYTLRTLVDADRRGDRAEVLLDAEQAALSASALRKQAAVNIARNGLEASTSLRDAQRTNDRALVAVEVISAIDLVLVGLCTLVLLAYQRGTERQADESRYRASHDGLTGVANRGLLNERMDAVLSRCEPTDGVALLLVDLNRFKEVNDTLGHHAGDELLKEVAARLSQAARRHDLVARLGGDEFAVLIPGVPDNRTATEIGERFHVALCGPMVVEGVMVDVSGSVGISRFPRPSANAVELLQHADIAMYLAKRGGYGVAFYRQDADTHSSERLSAVAELREAIERGDLTVHYQPLVRSSTHELHGVEALVRWPHPQRGLLLPAEFMPIVEENDLIPALTDLVVDRALAQHRAWADDGLDLPVAVNVGAACLLDPEFPSRVRALIERHRVAPGRLTAEITESGVLVDAARASAVLDDLRGLGVRLSIDDFGAGISAMEHLQSMPLDELKIDRTITAQIPHAQRGRAIVAALIELGHALRLEVVVEGVEDAATCAAVDTLGADLLQGYAFSRPLPPDELADWARASDPTRVAVPSGQTTVSGSHSGVPEAPVPIGP
ncbi:putative bifunctional diguanylate cyclase/phosphodiesterase [Cryptosporangium sp. NPDC051539]|uniref:putative bifunctional diguanylate cyclase/phosphodiesterase n=1 Tax=Cryptosporangium sp. NPDC051539 TaxID=3363962 RepID=UPI0037B1C2F9